MTQIEPAFGAPKWGSRLQAVWLVFSAAYLAVADLAPFRAVSSIMILIAGVLLLAILAHVIASNDVERIRKMLIVAMGATLFVIGTAFHGFKDYLAAGFAVVFALMLAALVWVSEEPTIYRRIQYGCFCSMSFALICGAIGFPVTLFLQHLIKQDLLLPNSFVYAPMGTACLAGLSVGLMVEGRVLSKRTYGHIPVPRKDRTILLLQALMLALVAGVIEEIINNGRIAPLMASIVSRLVLSTVYMLFLTLPTAVIVAELHYRSGSALLFSKRTTWVLIMTNASLGILLGLLMFRILPAASQFDHLVTQLAVGLTMGVGMVVALWTINTVSETVLSATVAPGTSESFHLNPAADG